MIVKFSIVFKDDATVKGYQIVENLKDFDFARKDIRKKLSSQDFVEFTYFRRVESDETLKDKNTMILASDFVKCVNLEIK